MFSNKKQLHKKARTTSKKREIRIWYEGMEMNGCLVDAVGMTRRKKGSHSVRKRNCTYKRIWIMYGTRYPIIIKCLHPFFICVYSSYLLFFPCFFWCRANCCLPHSPCTLHATRTQSRLVVSFRKILSRLISHTARTKPSPSAVFGNRVRLLSFGAPAVVVLKKSTKIQFGTCP